MRNLLLQQDKKIIKREYKLRIVIIVSMFVFFAIFIAVTLLIPSYVISVYKNETARTYAGIIKKKIEKREQGELGLVLNQTQNKINLLGVEKNQNTLTEIFKNILEEKSNGIKIYKLSYKKEDKDDFYKVAILGEALNREKLLQFKTNLGKEESFSEVVFPISNLASDKDIDFSITIKGKTQ